MSSSTSSQKVNSCEYGRAILEGEAGAISDVIPLINNQFATAVSLILELQEGGRIVVSGMGKAGYIGMKLSATLASIGLPSFFLHPAEAMHGDLGRYTKNDISIILSNSGETEEVVKIVPLIKRMSCPIISITAAPTSTLAEHSDIILQIGKVTEAGPLNLAPTTSTTAMLALGDALAMTVLAQKDFSAEQYAQFHPGGSLGRKLMRVEELMRTGEYNCVLPQTLTTRQVVHQMVLTKGRPGAAAIVNENNYLVGVFTDGNLRRCLDQDERFLDHPISEYMGTSPKTISPTALVQEALAQLANHQIDQLIVTSPNNTPIGLIDIQDLLHLT